VASGEAEVEGIVTELEAAGEVAGEALAHPTPQDEL
jgi:hypothetical protein